MGCFSLTIGCEEDKGATERSLQLDRQIKADGQEAARQVKLLLLGECDSGKSTIAKHMKILCKTGFTDEEKKDCIPVILSNTILSLGNILQAMPSITPKVDFKDPERESDCETFLTFMETLETKLPKDIAEHMKRLWNDEGVKACFGRANEYQLSDSAQYYLDNLERLSQPNYLPNEQDLLRSHVQTTGIVDYNFSYRDLNYHLVDIGCMRSERRKWIHCFEGVTCIIFCVSLSAYDLKSADDEEMNRMQESMKLFNSTCSSKWFFDIPVILIFNKMDLFEAKITKSPLTVCFPEYRGNSTIDEAAVYIQGKFEALNRREGRQIYTHFTCATNSGNLLDLFDTLAVVIIKNYLKDRGLF